ncbi:hypothetical protein [Pseudomonas sp. 34 E 7]|nr:hypothetical protein [Pseudomonas sp. 34 E 7]
MEPGAVRAGPAMAARTARPAHRGHPGAGLAGRQLEFRPTAHPGQPPGPLPARQGCGPGRVRGHRRRAFAAVADRSAGDHQGRWRLCAAGPGLPRRAPGLHARRQRRAPAVDPDFAARTSADDPRRVRDCHGQPAPGQLAKPAAGPAPARRQPRLCDLHLRFHRPAQGRGQYPRGAGRALAVDAGHLPVGRRRRADAKGADQFRRVGVGVLLAADHRLPSGAGGAG